MRILIVVPSQDRISGNWVTAKRFQLELEKRGHRVVLQATELEADDHFRQNLLDFAPSIAILLHAYRSGKPWLEVNHEMELPFVVMMTGTDINHGLHDPRQRPVIRTVLQRAACTLLQNPLIADELKTYHPDVTNHLRLLSPGITLGDSPYDLRKTHNITSKVVLFLCPAGLRPIKGLLELVRICDQVAASSTCFRLALCGPILDKSYADDLLRVVDERSWASYLGAITPEAMPQAMRGADVIVNNSHSEGLANALLEAATLGIPILARNIPGNAAVVRDRVNGRLFDNDTEFVKYALQLLDRKNRQELSIPDPERFDPGKEAAELDLILEQVVRGASKEKGATA